MDAFWNSAASLSASVTSSLHAPTGIEGNRASDKYFANDKLTHLPTANNMLMLWQEWLTAFTADSFEFPGACLSFFILD